MRRGVTVWSLRALHRFYYARYRERRKRLEAVKIERMMKLAKRIVSAG